MALRKSRVNNLLLQEFRDISTLKLCINFNISVFSISCEQLVKYLKAKFKKLKIFGAKVNKYILNIK